MKAKVTLDKATIEAAVRAYVLAAIPNAQIADLEIAGSYSSIEARISLDEPTDAAPPIGPLAEGDI